MFCVSALTSTVGCKITTKKVKLSDEFKTTADELYATFTEREV